MVIAKICVDGVTAVASGLSKIPKGIIGATIEVTFGSAWDGLSKTAVIRGAVTKDVLDVGNVIEIPAECVAMTGYNLKVGFYGTAGDTVAIPTVWADLGMVTDAADPSGDTTTDPALPVWAQLQNQVDALKQNGGGGGSGGGGGADGFSPIAKVEQTDTGAVITIIDKTGTTSATVTNGKDGYTPEKGKDYFTEDDKNEIAEMTAGLVEVPESGGINVTGAEVGQTIVVKAVDENGKPTEWECADAFKKDEYVVILNKVFAEDTPVGTPWGGEIKMTPDCHWWDRSADGEPYKLETIKVLIHTPKIESPTTGRLSVYVGRSDGLSASDGNAWIGDSPIWDNTTFPSKSETWVRYEYDLRNKNGSFAQNSTTNPIWARTAHSHHIGVEKLWKNTKWLTGVAIQFYGTIPAGTELMIYGKKIDENNPLPPAWEVST